MSVTFPLSSSLSVSIFGYFCWQMPSNTSYEQHLIAYKISFPMVLRNFKLTLYNIIDVDCLLSKTYPDVIQFVPTPLYCIPSWHKQTIGVPKTRKIRR